MTSPYDEPVGAKGDVRRRLREERRRLVSARDLDSDAAALAAGLAPFVSGLEDAATVLSYESRPHEPPTGEINAALRAAGHHVLVPITLPDMRLDWRDLDDPEARPQGLQAPRRADLAIVPALTVDETGTRMGQGGGCYDRVLPMLPRHVPVVALLHPGEHTTGRLPREDHDVPIPVVLTAEGLHRTDPQGPVRP